MTLERARIVLICVAQDREWTPAEEALYTVLMDMQMRLKVLEEEKYPLMREAE